MLQELIVALIIIAAVAYVAWRYLPAPLRRRLGRLHPNLAAGPGGCGSGCSSCGGCAAAKGAAQERPPSSAAPSQVGR